MRIINKYLTSLLLLLSLSACDSMKTIIADFEMEGSISLLTTKGEKLEEIQLNPLPRNPSRLSPYSDLAYNGKVLSAVLNINSDHTQIVFTNKLKQPIILRLDEGKLSSNFHDKEIDLKAYKASIRVSGQATHSGRIEPGTQSLVPQLVLLGGQKGSVGMAPVYGDIYPNHRLFNVKFQGKQEILLETGIGNRLNLRIPIEYEGKREILLLQLQPKAVNVRSSYR